MSKAEKVEITFFLVPSVSKEGNPQWSLYVSEDPEPDYKESQTIAHNESKEVLLAAIEHIKSNPIQPIKISVLLP
jgi:hypothetical protein